jgi:hypothetical protein
MSQQAQPPLPSPSTPSPVETAIAPGSLRAEMEARRASGERFSVKEALGIIVPLCTQIAAAHGADKLIFVYPGVIRYTRGGEAQFIEERAHVAPTLPRDRSCLAPEERKGEAGDTRASVFTIGAILYELITNASIGPGMRRPSEVVADLPRDLEVILGKALVADPKHRPGDLGALAQALHHIAPNASVAPPPADESHLDHDGTFDVDIRLSMIPPNEAAAVAIPRAAAVPKLAGVEVQGDGPFAVAIRREEPKTRNLNDPTQRLADLKASLEADPRPRYVVIKDGMDHGPFSAVELLQQIASGLFTADNVLRDTISSEERFIKDWDEFVPFAEHAKLNRDIVQEKKDLDAVVVAEKKGTQYKALVGAAVLGVVLAGAAGWWWRDRKSKDHEREVQGQTAVTVDVDGGLGAGKKDGPVGGGGVARSGNYPVLGGGMSCETARSRYVEDFDKSSPPDLTAGAYGKVLNNGTYLNACGVPESMKVTVCAAVQNGRAVGVTVSTQPRDTRVSSCVSGAVRGLSFPSHPRLDVTTTTF